MKHFPNKIKGVRLSSDINSDLSETISALQADKVFFLFDENTYKFCRPLLSSVKLLSDSNSLILKSGEENKNLDQVKRVWDFFEDEGAGRNSVLVTIGGGMLTDLGGFAACTFKRGMSFVNVPTTLLAMVDASVGGKTGINYHGLKNEIGIIKQPNNVLIFAPFLNSLDQENFISGFAEMLKAGLIQDQDLWQNLIKYSLETRDIEPLIPLIWRSVQIKYAIVEIDPEEKSDRRALNFGHTFAHAFESLSLKLNKHIPHGYAVAYGMIFESILSLNHCGLKPEELEQISEFIRSIYNTIPFTVKDIEQLIQYMRSDKKNDNSLINITMLERIGRYRVNNYIEEEQLEKVLEETLAR